MKIAEGLAGGHRVAFLSRSRISIQDYNPHLLKLNEKSRIDDADSTSEFPNTNDFEISSFSDLANLRLYRLRD